MRTIYKYDLDPFNQYLDIHRGALLRHVHEQNGQLRVWAEVDTDQPIESMPVVIIPTGGNVPENTYYVGSGHIPGEVGTMFVFHVYGYLPERLTTSFVPTPGQMKIEDVVGG
jgi:hypothetical protein